MTAAARAVAREWGQAAAAAPGALGHARTFSSQQDPNEAVRRAERMVELMASSPHMQQMMLGMLPSALRRPEVLQQMFSDPDTKKKIAEMIAKRGMPLPDTLLDRMTPASMESTFSSAQRMGLDPGKVLSRLMGHPGLVAKLQDPRVMQAFLEIGQDPSAQAKYAHDTELLEVVTKVREILASERAAAAPAATSSAPASSGSAAIQLGSGAAAPAPEQGQAAEAASAGGSTSSTSSATISRQPPSPGQGPAEEASAAAGPGSEAAQPAQEGQAEAAAGGTQEGGAEANPLVALMMSDPKSAQWLDNPRVMKALEEVSKSPWKTVKYVFDRDVMAAFKDLKMLMQGKKP